MTAALLLLLLDFKALEGGEVMVKPPGLSMPGT